MHKRFLKGTAPGVPGPKAGRLLYSHRNPQRGRRPRAGRTCGHRRPTPAAPLRRVIQPSQEGESDHRRTAADEDKAEEYPKNTPLPSAGAPAPFTSTPLVRKDGAENRGGQVRPPDRGRRGRHPQAGRHRRPTAPSGTGQPKRAPDQQAPGPRSRAVTQPAPAADQAQVAPARRQAQVAQAPPTRSRETQAGQSRRCQPTPGCPSGAAGSASGRGALLALRGTRPSECFQAPPGHRAAMVLPLSER